MVSPWPRGLTQGTSALAGPTLQLSLQRPHEASHSASDISAGGIMRQVSPTELDSIFSISHYQGLFWGFYEHFVKKIQAGQEKYSSNFFPNTKIICLRTKELAN